MKIITTVLIYFFLFTSISSQSNSFDETLPVELVYFDAIDMTDSILVIWGTATELNNYGFYIQRSFEDSLNFTDIGFVLGHGTSFSPKDYEYGDSTMPESGTYYYRLKQIDTDGLYEYSWIISIDFVTDLPDIEELIIKDFSLFQNYPNPFNPSTTISFEIAKRENIRLEVINSLGETVDVVFKGRLSAGVHEFNFNASGLTSGVYFYRLKSQNHSLIKKMILLR
ncbi:MAG: T9SS type A sorting domain-containing protein [Melioribacteraceae bacterium]|nr:T9SS type A sorting domain-containing protein [Melioribacteraceae bacterium]MCF8356551.1 T9SS type A sorting domain-containing protein [Melioribacteraceae bacterium]MCF8394210.1 T9SS type A sorting domain-containing protein [Melioribacteraceae bacterium]MCF8419930.1 T9SS type A sorting domain-containing protein [Melioribacteraceae bacterium]